MKKRKPDELIQLHDYLDVCMPTHYIDIWNPFPMDVTYVCDCGKILSYQIFNGKISLRAAFHEDGITIGAKDKPLLAKSIPLHVLRRVQERYDFYTPKEWKYIDGSKTSKPGFKLRKKK